MKTTIIILSLGLAACLTMLGLRSASSCPKEEFILVVNQHQIQVSGSSADGWRVVDFDTKYDETEDGLDAALQPALDLALGSP